MCVAERIGDCRNCLVDRQQRFGHLFAFVHHVSSSKIALHVTPTVTRVRYANAVNYRTRKATRVSNHWGSYLLRDTLTLLNEGGVWAHMSQTAAQQLVIRIVNLACDHYDCNAGEILDGHDALGICYDCRTPAEPLRRGLCLNCWPADDAEDDPEEDS
jgi:hypothetical protein